MKRLVKESLILNEDLKDELITRILSTVFKNDNPKYRDSNIKYLDSLSIEKLEDMIYLYNLQGIKH